MYIWNTQLPPGLLFDLGDFGTIGAVINQREGRSILDRRAFLGWISVLEGANMLQDAIFAGTTTITFSATAGIGFKWNHFYGPTQAELGYRFFYLGQGNFKPLTNQTLNNLTTGDAFANALLFTIIV